MVKRRIQDSRLLWHIFCLAQAVPCRSDNSRFVGFSKYRYVDTCFFLQRNLEHKQKEDGRQKQTVERSKVPQIYPVELYSRSPSPSSVKRKRVRAMVRVEALGLIIPLFPVPCGRLVAQ